MTKSGQVMTSSSLSVPSLSVHSRFNDVYTSAAVTVDGVKTTTTFTLKRLSVTPAPISFRLVSGRVYLTSSFPSNV